MRVPGNGRRIALRFNHPPEMKEETRLKLAALPLFAEFNNTELDAFLELLDPIAAQPGELIVRQDEPGDTMFIIIEGKVRVIHREQGKPVELARLCEGAFFGELALIDHLPRSADVEALEPATLLSISQGTVRAIVGVCPSAAFKLLIAIGRVLVDRLRSGNRKYIDSLLAGAPSNLL